MKDLKCVGLAVWNQSVALVHPSMPAKTIGEFVELARSKPGVFNFGNPGTGSSIDLSAQKLFQAANIKLTNVGYKGQPPALIDLMTNLMHFEIVSLALALPHIKAGHRQAAGRIHRQTRRRPARRADDRGGRISRSAPMSPGTASMCRQRRRTPSSRRSTTPSTRRCKIPDVQRQLSVADIPGKPMSLADLAALMKADHEKLTTVVKTSGMALQ